MFSLIKTATTTALHNGTTRPGGLLVSYTRRFLTSDDTRSIDEYFRELGIRPELHNNVLESAKRIVGNNDATKITVASLSQALGGDEGVLQLAKSIQDVEQKSRRRKERRKQRPKIDVTLRILQPTGNPPRETTFSWRYGESLLTLAQSPQVQNELQGELEGRMEGSCGGQMGCSTCQVYLDQITYDALSPPVEEELDMLDLAFEPTGTSRLGCQIKLDDTLVELSARHNIVVTIPSSANDEWEG